MKKWLTFLFAIFCYSNSLAQRDWNWQLSSRTFSNYPKAQLNFANGNPDTSSVVRFMGFFLTNASISDNNGNYLFCSNGQFISNANHDTLQNSLSFNPGWETDTFYVFNQGQGSTQALIILPHPDLDSTNLFYMFHESSSLFYNRNNKLDAQPYEFRYSVIDLNLDGGMGGILSDRKTISLINDTLIKGRITTTKHANGRDCWIIKHQYMSDLYYKILLTPNGCSVDSQHIGTLFPDSFGSSDFDVFGQAHFSLDGNKYMQMGPNNLLELLDFDRCSGVFSNHRTAYIQFPVGDGVWGASFSPNGRFVYATSADKCYQIDTWQANLQNGISLVATYDGFIDNFETYFFFHQLGPDGKIYISTFNGNTYLHVIDQPDSLGMSCNFLQHSLRIMGMQSSNGSVPNFPNYNLGADTTSLCDSLHVGYSEQQNNITLIKAWPNPASSVLNVGYRLPEGKTGWIKIYNTHGKLLQQTPLPNYSTLQHIDVSFLSNGIYLVSIESAGKRKSVRFAVVKNGE